MDAFERQFLPLDPGKQPLVLATVKWVSKNGLYKLTLAEIARQAGVSRPRLNYHYSSLTEVFADLVPCWGRSGQAVTLECLSQSMGAPPDELILKMVDATFEWKTKCPHWAAMTPALNQMAQLEKPISLQMQSITDQGLQRIQGLVTQIPSLEKKAKATAQAIHMTMVGGFLYHLSVKKLSDKKMKESVRASIEMILNYGE